MLVFDLNNRKSYLMVMCCFSFSIGCMAVGFLGLAAACVVGGVRGFVMACVFSVASGVAPNAAYGI